MDKYMAIILPKDVWTLISNYTLKDVCSKCRKFSKYIYLIKTFVENISYMGNKNPLGTTEHLSLFMSKKQTTLSNQTEYITTLNLDEEKTHECEIFSKIFKSSNVGVFKYACSVQCDDQKYRIYEDVCRNGCLEMLKHLTRTLRITRENFLEHHRDVLECVCKNRNFQISEYLILFENLTEHHRDVMERICENRNFQTLKYLITKFQLTLEDNIDFRNIFLSILHSRNIEVLKYLIRTFDPTPGLTRRNMDAVDVLRTAIEIGDMNMLRYLVETFISRHGYMATREAIVYIYKRIGNIDQLRVIMLRYLTKTFDLTPTEAAIQNKSSPYSMPYADTVI